jgi:CheY-like chemotaxis protein
MPRILVVDDEPSCRGPLSQLLELEGYEVATAEDGLEALQRMQERRPDLVLLDLLMPRMDGVQFLEKVRSEKRYEGLPILLVTGQHDSRLQAKATGLGVQEYLFKTATPFMKLLTLIQKHLGLPGPLVPPRPSKPKKADRDRIKDKPGEQREQEVVVDVRPPPRAPIPRAPGLGRPLDRTCLWPTLW